MITNNSLKEYYVKLHGMYVQCYDMIKAMSQSLTTKDSEISLVTTSPEGKKETIRIPSFLYLESKLENLSTDFNSIIELPKSGEAWLQGSSDLYKIDIIKNDVAPITPEVSTTNSSVNNLVALFKDNTFIKDLVSPKTYLKINLSNMLNIQSSMLMKKIVFYESDVYNALSSYTSYEDIKSALYNYTNGVDYEEYDSTLDIPIRKNKYNSKFEISEIPSQEETGTPNPYTSALTSKLVYRLKFDTFEYTNRDDSSICYTLKEGDLLSMPDQSTIWKVKSLDYDDMTIDIEEVSGHTALQSISENSGMYFNVYDKNYSDYHYVEVPLEENQYICIFLANVVNNIQSDWSTPLFIDLNTIYVKDSGGNYIQDSYGNKLTYLQYYKQYCVNIGDLILGLTETMYPQVSNFTTTELNDLKNSDLIQNAVSESFDTDTILQVVPINKHLVDDTTNDEIKKLHAEKNDYNQQISTLQANINQVYNTLTTTDFSKETSFTQADLKNKLSNYYTQRETLQKQLSSIVDQINTKATELSVTGNEVKYRIRGVTNISTLNTSIASITDYNVEIVGMDLEYKYKSTTKDTTSLNSINSSTFTDWNKLNNIDRQREVKFSTNGFSVDFVDYNTTDNIVKWNQVDIPIQQGEDVIIRVRYKYNIGQPFFNFYTPWSEEKLAVFPEQYKEDVDLTTIISENSDDTVTSAFSKTLIDEGYSEHIQDKIVSSDAKFFHMPESIYSGFNTSENKLISLKDKLYDINSSLEEYKTTMENETNSKFELYITFDNTSIQLSPNSVNTINIYNNEHISDIFIKKNITLTIKNSGTVRVNLYSIFPGNTDEALIDTDINAFEKIIGNYERVPMLVSNEIKAQKMGQWIYFRSNSPWTGESIYYDNQTQIEEDLTNITNKKKLEYEITPSMYLSKSNYQVLLGYRERANSSNYTSNSSYSKVRWNGFHWDHKDIIENGQIPVPSWMTKSIEDNYNSSSQSIYAKMRQTYGDWYNYGLNSNNNWLMRYEDICGSTGNKSDVSTLKYLSEQTTFTDFRINQITNFTSDADFVGAFAYPSLESFETIMTDGKEKSSKYLEVGESLSIPLVFEYYVRNASDKISKSIYFDLRNSLVKDPMHFMVEFVGHYDYTQSGNIYSTTSELSDTASTL